MVAKNNNKKPTHFTNERTLNTAFLLTCPTFHFICLFEKSVIVCLYVHLQSTGLQNSQLLFSFLKHKKYVKRLLRYIIQTSLNFVTSTFLVISRLNVSVQLLPFLRQILVSGVLICVRRRTILIDFFMVFYQSIQINAAVLF